MEFDVEPEPGEEVRAALAAALEARAAADALAAAGSAWWRAGVRESTPDEPEDLVTP